MSISSEIARLNANIASAYSACRLKGAVIPPVQDSDRLPATIDSIDTGDDTLIFFDIDGTVVYSYTRAGALALSALPEPPDHPGLISQGWAWTLDEIKSTVASGRKCTVGGFYRTDDDSLRLYIRLESGETDFAFGIYQPTNYDSNHDPVGVSSYTEIDWGDGTAPYTTDSDPHTDFHGTRYTASHTYSPSAYPAEYVITLSRADADDRIDLAGIGVSSGQLLYKAEFSRYSYLMNGLALSDCRNLRSISVPDDFYFPARCFEECHSLRAIVCCSNISEYTFYRCYDLRYVCLKSSVTSIGDSSFRQCFQLVRVGGMERLTQLADCAFQDCRRLTEACICSAESLGREVFYGCGSLSGTIVIPPTVKSMGHGCFYDCEDITAVVLRLSCTVPNINLGNSVYVQEYDLTYYTDPSGIPQLSLPFDGSFNSKNLIGTKVRFTVADEAMKQAFSSATNWSDGAEYYVVKES